VKSQDKKSTGAEVLTSGWHVYPGVHCCFHPGVHYHVHLCVHPRATPILCLSQCPLLYPLLSLTLCLVYPRKAIRDCESIDVDKGQLELLKHSQFASYIQWFFFSYRLRRIMGE
jgi:hypothetical protein